jgi:hypothetical protein
MAMQAFVMRDIVDLPVEALSLKQDYSISAVAAMISFCNATKPTYPPQAGFF